MSGEHGWGWSWGQGARQHRTVCSWRQAPGAQPCASLALTGPCGMEQRQAAWGVEAAGSICSTLRSLEAAPQQRPSSAPAAPQQRPAARRPHLTPTPAPAPQVRRAGGRLAGAQPHDGPGAGRGHSPDVHQRVQRGQGHAGGPHRAVAAQVRRRARCCGCCWFGARGTCEAADAVCAREAGSAHPDSKDQGCAGAGTGRLQRPRRGQGVAGEPLVHPAAGGASDRA